MPNPTKHSDILQDDGAIDAAILKLEKFGRTGVEVLENVKKAAKKMEEELVGVSATTGDNREQIGKTAKEVDVLEKEYRKLEDALSDNNKKLAVLREGKKKANAIARNEAKLVLAAEGSYNQLSARYSLIKIRLNEMSDAQRKATKEGQNLEKEAKAIREEMNLLQTATGNTALNVGNYTESIKEALAEMNQFPGAAGGFVGGVKGMIGQVKTFLKQPLVLVLGAIVSGLALVANAFFKTERGQKLLEKGTAILNATMSVLVMIVDKVADGLVALFDGGIVEGIKGIGKALLDNLVNRFKAIIDLGGILGRSLKAIWDGDMKALEQAALDTGTAMTKLFTGLDKEQQKAVVDAIKETANESVVLTNKFTELAKATRERTEENARLTRSLGKLQEAEAVAQVSANDTTLSFKKQLEALDDLEKAQKARLETEIQIARNNFATINDEVKLRRSAGEDVLGLLDQQAAALLELQQLETEYKVSVLEAGKLRREIRRDEFEKGLDFAIDFYDAQKRLLERQAADENNSFEMRREALARIVELDKSAFGEQQGLLEDFTKQKLDLNQLALEDDERVVRERLAQYDLDEITLTRILEVLKERKAATQDIVELEEKLTAERNKQNAAPESLELFDFGEAAEDEAAKRIGDLASNALAKGREQFREEIEKNKVPENIYDVLGIDFGNGDEQFRGALDFAKQQLFEFASFRKQIADQNVENANREVESAEAALQRELENQTAGSASRIATAEEELEAAKKTQQKALDEQRKAQRAEQRLQTIQQAVNLVTATSKIWAQLGFPLAIPATAVLWGSFVASKVRAAQLTKKTNRKGMYKNLDFGGSHESGHDIHIGGNEYAERGEGLAVFTAKARKKYGTFLPQLVDAMNRGEMEKAFALSSGDGIDAKSASEVKFYPTSNNKAMEKYLKIIADNSGREQETTDGKGRRVRRYKNERTIINN